MRTLLYILILSIAALLVVTSSFPGSGSVLSFLTAGTDSITTSVGGIGRKTITTRSQDSGDKVLSTRPLIMNSTFDEGIFGWSFYTDSIGSFIVASTTVNNRAGKITISKAGNNIQLYQQDIVIRPHVNYRLSFTARSSAGNGLSVSLFKQDEQAKSYGLPGTYFELSTTTKNYSVDFSSSGFDHPVSNAKLMFWFTPYADIGDEYWFDNIFLTDLNSPAASSSHLVGGQEPTVTPDRQGSMIAVTSSDPRRVAPIISPQGGKYQDQVVVNISSQPGAIIYYTLDGSVPTSASSLYDGPLTLKETAKLSAYAVQNGMPDTQRATSTFVIGRSEGRALANGSFEAGMNNWNFITDGYAVFAVAPSTRSSRSGYVLISEAGNITALYQKGIILEPNTEYKVTFIARSSVGHGATLSIVQAGNPSSSYGLSNKHFALSSDWKNYSATFVTSGFEESITDARLQFTFTPYAAFGDEYWLDEIVLEKI